MRTLIYTSIFPHIASWGVRCRDLLRMLSFHCSYIQMSFCCDLPTKKYTYLCGSNSVTLSMSCISTIFHLHRETTYLPNTFKTNFRGPDVQRSFVPAYQDCCIPKLKQYPWMANFKAKKNSTKRANKHKTAIQRKSQVQATAFPPIESI